MQVRARLIRWLKRIVRAALGRSGTRKLVRLIAEEYALHEAVRSLEATRPFLEERVPTATVLRGPFSGLRYEDGRSVGSAYWPKILGSYELELHGVIEEACREEPDVVVDIGAAEGYYAVGFARRLPGARVHAFEGNPRGRDMLRRMVESNGVAGRVNVLAWCDREALESVLDAAPRDACILVFCDAEGSEYELLDPEKTPVLARCRIILELHQRVGRQPRRWVEETFADTHELTLIDVAPRTGDAIPELEGLPPLVRQHVLFERLDLNGWASLRPRGAPAG